MNRRSRQTKEPRNNRASGSSPHAKESLKKGEKEVEKENEEEEEDLPPGWKDDRQAEALLE